MSELKPGSSVSVSYLDVSHKTQNIQLIYVGLIEDEYLILRFPNQRVYVNSKIGIAPGAHLSFKIMLAQERLNVLTFKASSLGLSKLREPVLLVQYPEKVYSQALRTQPRLSVEAMAELVIVESKESFLTMVSDFSLTGLKCSFNLTEQQEAAYNKEKIEALVDHKVKINFGVNNDFESDFEVTGTIKNARKNGKIMVGVQFDAAKSDLVKTVFAILLMRLHGL
ncbi:PilZ domain-containing protein [Catenovulum sp. 2E275]|uniref:PilZ domain-containing protein n=1 Tax=Catenovulum sp. 2E275 TaxID=2980497 RepID=UPI0021D23C82|nr:PilZ domain-containing protein [Catenovulum sp. 2E275]MCU4675706.1 PilZ domain-containing protein [Catenovulum sp. 2E275]